MNLRLNTISKRLFLAFGILVFNIIVIASLSIRFLLHTHTVSTIGQSIDTQRILIVNLIKTDLDFLRYETVNQEFFATGESVLLDQRDSIYKLIQTGNRTLYKEMLRNNFLIDYEIHQIDSSIADYNQDFTALVDRINERGFKDYGVEGKMREYAHELEALGVLDMTDLLTLRRHEKDFLLRKEQQYADLFNNVVDDLQSEGKKRAGTLEILSSYRSTFNNLVDLNYRIGITPRDGLLGELARKTKTILGHLGKLNDLSNERANQIIEHSVTVFSIVTAITVILSVLLTYYTSVRLARPIKRLSNSIGKFMINEGMREEDLEAAIDTNEIRNLGQAFITLTHKLKAQFAEIQTQNKELKKLNEELDRFIYSAAHDLKSPLSSMEGLILLAERDIDSGEHKHYFKMMLASLHKLEGFIKDITDYAKNKRQQLRVEPIQLEEMIAGIADSLRFLPDAERLHVNIHVRGDVFFTDRARIEIILKNLISNSFRYLDTAKAESTIAVDATVTNENLRLRIYDNGIGIDQSHLPRIYDMFYRAVDHSQGTGIGLFLVKEAIKILGGKIKVTSKLGEWTSFVMLLPNLGQKAGTLSIPESAAITNDEMGIGIT